MARKKAATATVDAPQLSLDEQMAALGSLKPPAGLKVMTVPN